MLTFLAPAALFGLLLLAIPVIVHLLKPRKVRRTPFSSLRWLHLTQQRLSRRLQWHQLLLFLLRAAFVALLVAAVAKPIVDRRTDSGPAERFVVVDVSRSMGYRTGEGPTPLDRGKQAAAALLAGGGAEDRTALLTVGTKARIVGPPSRDAQRYAPQLAALTVEPTDTDLAAALDTVRTLVGRRGHDARIELFVVTDDHQGAWRPGAVESFAAEFGDRLQTTIIDVADKGSQNGWIADARYTPAENGSPPVVDVQLRAVGAGVERTVRLTGASGLNERSQPVALDPQRPLDVRFELPLDFDPRGKTCEVVLDPPDALPSDDRWFLSFDGGAALKILVVEGRGDPTRSASPGFALRTAIEALSSPQASFQTTLKKNTEVEPADFAQVDVVLLADVPELSDVALDALAERVQRGLGLGVFLGPGVSAEFYNQRFIDPLDQTKSLLPARLDRVVDVPLAAGGLAPLETVAWDHPLLAGLFDPAVGDLAATQLRSYYRFAAPPGAGATVLATTADTPLIVDRAVGSGKVVLFNTTADDAWGDLPRRKSFVPLVDRLLNYISGGALKRTFTTGEAVALAVPPLAAGESLAVIAPSGEVQTPTIAATAGGTRLTLPPQSVPGVYHLRRSGGNVKNSDLAEAAFVVQVGRGDSALAPLDADALRSRWQPARCEIVSADSTKFATTGEAASLVPWFAALAALLLAVETIVVHRLCPRINPQLAESMIQRRRPIVSSSGTGVSPLSPIQNADPFSMPIRGEG
jgi:hypothetical protein